MNRTSVALSLLVAAPTAAQCLGSHADFEGWQDGSYTASNGEAPNWFVLPPNENRSFEIACTDGRSSLPAIWFGDCSVGCREFEFTMKGNGRDDDSIGFVIGYRDGDATNPNADYLAVIWNRSAQWAEFPGCAGGRAQNPAGLQLVRVTGVPDPAEFWCQGNLDLPCSDLSAGLEVLASGETRGNSAWPRNTAQDVTVRVTPAGLSVTIEGTTEFDLQLDMTPYLEGSLGFYSQGQAADFWGLEIDAVDSSILARSENYGTGTPGCDGIPSLSIESPPVIGSQPRIEIGNAGTTQKLGAMIWSGQPAETFVPFLDLHFTVAAPFAAVVTTPVPAGGFVFECSIPDNACTAGDQLFLQWVGLHRRFF